MKGKSLKMVLLGLVLSCGFLTNAATYYVSPTGNDSNNGTSSSTPLKTFSTAVGKLSAAGDILYVMEGRFSLSSGISLSRSGTSGKPISIIAYNGANVVLDFSSQSTGSVGISLSADYNYIKGIKVLKAGDNGLKISGDYNVIEMCSFIENRDSGVQLGGGAANNKIINCDSYYNADPTDYGDADGFACKLDVGTGNYFYGCRAWQNCDDAWDGYMRATNSPTTTIENSWAFRNGWRRDGSDPGTQANGNGFKMGGCDNTPCGAYNHNFIVTNCLAFMNKSKGFDQNNNTGSMTLTNCTGWNNNGNNYSLPAAPYTGKTFKVTNCAELGGKINLNAATVLTTNSWMAPISTTTADFTSIDTTGVTGPRQADGSLPILNFMRLKAGSDLIDAGTPQTTLPYNGGTGIPYNGTKPDLGCFETGVTTTYTLSTATAGTGAGTVTLSPAGGAYASGTVVTVTANATSGSFTGWSGAATGTTNPTTVTVTSNSTITANFGTPTYYALTTSVVGSGSIGLNPTGGNYVAGTVVTLTATPSAGFTFSGWSGAVTGTTNPTTVTMSAAKTVTATFTAIPAGAKKVAYVTDAAGATYVNDTKILPALKADANLIVTELDGKVANDYSGYDVIVLSEIPQSTAAGLVAVETSGKPIVMMKVHAYKVAPGAWGWTTDATAYGQDATTITNVVVSNTSHPIFNGVTFVNTNEVQLISAVAGSKGITYMNPTAFNPISGGTASSIAYLKGATAAKSSILQIPAGTNINGTTLAKDLIQIGINGSSYANVTADGVQIVKNAIYYLTGVTTDVDEVKTTTFSCVPNPVESTTELTLPSDEASVIAVYDLSGRKVKEMVAQATKVTLDLTDLNAGLYLITVTSNNQVMQQRIVKK